MVCRIRCQRRSFLQPEIRRLATGYGCLESRSLGRSKVDALILWTSASASSVSEKKIKLVLTAQRMGKTVEIVTDCAPANATDENVQTWWKAASEDENPWLQIDLGKAYDVHAIQINFADDAFTPDPLPDDFHLNEALMQQRWIDTDPQKTRWLLEGSVDGTHFSPSQTNEMQIQTYRMI